MEKEKAVQGETTKKKSRGGKAYVKKATTKSLVEIKSEQEAKEGEVIHRQAYAEFVKWSVMPESEKKGDVPKTQRDFAKKWGIREMLLSEWKKRKEFKTLRSEAMKSAMAEKTADVLWSLYDRIKLYGKAEDVALWLAYSEGWDAKKAAEQSPSLDFGMDDIRSLIRNLPKEEAVEFYTTLAKLIAKAETIKQNAGINTVGKGEGDTAVQPAAN